MEKDVILTKDIDTTLFQQIQIFHDDLYLKSGMEVHVRIKNIVKVSKKNSDIDDAVLMSLLPTWSKVYRAVWLYLLLNQNMFLILLDGIPTRQRSGQSHKYIISRGVVLWSLLSSVSIDKQFPGNRLYHQPPQLYTSGK